MKKTICPKCKKDNVAVYTLHGKPAMYVCRNCDFYLDMTRDTNSDNCPECGSSDTATISTTATATVHTCNTCDAEYTSYAKPKTNNEVDHPSHYQNGMKTEVECIMFTRNLSFSLGNAFKYIWRAGAKKSAAMDTDLAKAMWYLTDVETHLAYEKSMYNPQTANLVHFLPKNNLLDWKYQILSCILYFDIKTATQLLTSGMTDPAS